ncbi:MAG: alpha/beta hydrolase, partial [Dehalococcoidia bacterium]|nr:alpha/beta hydrolase [Dehalococcoidia bacterium]
AAALALGGLAFVITAIVAPSVGVALGVGGMVGGVTLLAVGVVAFGRIAPAWRLLFAELYVALVLLLVGAGIWSVISQPVVFQATPLTVPNVQFWEFPGDVRIAYVRLDPPGVPNPTPVVYLHGGPGFVGTANAEALRPLAEAGFTVYAYDQVGSGLSSRLPLPSDYTVERHLRDLARIRAAIGASSVHLVGHSYGAVLAAHSVANQGDWVSRVALIAPGPLSPESVRAQPSPGLRLSAELQAQLAAEEAAVFARGGARWSLWLALRQLSLNVAHSYIGDAEADAVKEALLAATQRFALCDPTRAFPRPTRGAGLYANLATRQDLAQLPDIRPRLGAARGAPWPQRGAPRASAGIPTPPPRRKASAARS